MLGKDDLIIVRDESDIGQTTQISTGNYSHEMWRWEQEISDIWTE